MIDDRRGTDAVLELDDAGLDLGLLVLRVVVLRVLGDVAEVARLLDAIGDLTAAFRLEVLELCLELLQAFTGKDDVARHCGPF